VEIKAIKKLVEENEAQLLNYLRATNIEVGLLLNFGPEPEIRRKAFLPIGRQVIIAEKGI